MSNFMCFASSVYKSVYCGSVMIQKSYLLSICVYRCPYTSLFCAECFVSVLFLLCLITGSVSHIWSIYHSKNNWLIFDIKHVVEVSTEYHCRSKCMEAAMNRYA